jgi:hypothetical protein
MRLNRRVLQRTAQDIWARNADADPEEIQRVVEKAVRQVRVERRTKEKPDKAHKARAALVNQVRKLAEDIDPLPRVNLQHSYMNLRTFRP